MTIRKPEDVGRHPISVASWDAARGRREENMRLPRTLDPVEIRVLGALLEKEQTTPDQYPLTINALVAACSQRSNRDPVMDLTAADVANALDRLHGEVMVWPSSSARTERWRHSVDRRWELDPAAKAVITVLLLRGPQTPGELRSRTDRMHPFPSTVGVEEALLGLAAGEDPLVVQLERRPGQKEARWGHLVGGPPEESAPSPAAPEAVAARAGLADRVADLEARVDRLERRLRELTG